MPVTPVEVTMLTMTRVTLALSLALSLPALAAAPVAKKGKGAAKAEMGEVTWKVEPGDVIISVDGKKIGPASKAKPVKLKAGQHLVHLKWNKDEVEEPVMVEANKSIEFQYAFEDSGAGKPAPQPAE